MYNVGKREVKRVGKQESAYEKFLPSETENGRTYWHNVKKLKGSGTEVWQMEPSWHEQLEIKYILSGSAEILCGTDIFIAKRGDIIVINPYELHGMRVIEGEVSYDLLILSLDFPFAGEIKKKYRRMYEGKLISSNLLSGEKKISGIITSIFDELKKEKEGYEICVEAYISVLVALIFRHCNTEEKRAGGYEKFKRYGERIQPALNYINLHYTENIKVPHLASLCSMSVYHFCRMFKNTTNCTAVEYINELRINHACMLLLTTENSIADIAYSVGYKDELYFSRCFKGQKGISPSRFRKENKKKETENREQRAK